MDHTIGIPSFVLLHTFNTHHFICWMVCLMNVLKSTLQILINKNFNEGTSHWFKQRVSSVILIPLTVIFMFTFIQNVGLGYETNINFYKSPLSAFLTFLFIYFTLLHFKQGAQVVIEDYVDDKLFHRVLLTINVIFFWGMNILVVFSLAKLVFE